MSLTEKVIKNTYYYLLFQILGFVFPLILTPFIISKIGDVQFGIYVLVLGFVGTISILDLSLSNSFIKFISEHYNKNQFKELNEVINTGLLFYILFSLLFCLIGYFLAEPLLSLLNIPQDLSGLSIYAFKMSLLIFFVSTAFGIFNSILISLQKMYLTSIWGILLNGLNFASIIILLSYGFGLKGLIWSQFVSVSLSILISYIVTRKSLPQMKLGTEYFSKTALKKMLNFGLQMQVSKLSSFASAKYDEFLLGYFSVMSNITFYNVGARIARISRFLPFQLVPQVAPVAAELQAKGETEKLKQLFDDTTKYLNIITVPISVYIFVFADVLILAWLGDGYGISAYILRILVIGQLINMTLSAPGNSIIPNIGIPKYQMYEGLICLCLNLVLSFILIKYFGIIGAAIGNTVSIGISSVYIFIVSSSYFSRNTLAVFKEKYLKPFLIAIASSSALYILYYISDRFFYDAVDRISAIVYLVPSVTAFILMYLAGILNVRYLNKRDKEILIKILFRIIPVKYILARRTKKFFSSEYAGKAYGNELISIFIVTYNRLDFLKKCIDSLLTTLSAVNYEIIIWDNNSSDGTTEYLKSIESSRIKIVLNPENIGTNAKSEAAQLCSGKYLIGIDDDVIDYPFEWMEKMIFAYNNIPLMGYLAADVVQDEFTDGAKHTEDEYSEKSYADGKVILQMGPTGGWCFLISREVYNKVGKFKKMHGRIFFGEDGDYLNRLFNKGYRYGILKNVKVYHATGEYYNIKYKNIFEKKMQDYYVGKVSMLYYYKIKFGNIFNIRRYYYKFLELAEKEINKPA